MSLTPLDSMRAPAIIFAGQASEWEKQLRNAAASHHAVGRLNNYLTQARSLVSPYARTIASTVPGAMERLEELVHAGSQDTGASEHTTSSNNSTSSNDVFPAVSVPGIVLSQLAAIDQLRDLGLNLAGCDPEQGSTQNNPTTAFGHSQGSLGIAAIKHPVHALALAILMGTAANVTHGSTDSRSHMLLIRDLPRDVVEQSLNGTTTGSAAISVVNGTRAFVVSGTPDELAAVENNVAAHASAYNDALEAREFGGSELTPNFTYLPVALPFHHDSLTAAAELTIEWAQACQLDLGETDIATVVRDILVRPFDWTAQTAQMVDQHISHALVLDDGLAKLTTPLVAGTGLSVVPAWTPSQRDNLATPGAQLPTARDWSEFAPRLVTLPDGKTYTQTKFSALTGLSPIMLGGMTPTTVDPAIVAAAANAGFWTEMAGGGMYSEELFTELKNSLIRQLQPGRTVAFNTMFFDRFMWNLQFGQARIVPKARANGAPITGVTISAGVPEADEATELLAQLRADGFPYISFKPGTTKQIRDILAIAAANPEHQLILQIEDGHAGGHHSWLDLDEMLIDTYAAAREHDNVTITVGGGIYSAERAAEYLTGTWSQKYSLPRMPVDGVFVGTVAMATKEATTSPQVKQLLVDTPGISPETNGGWVGRGRANGGVASGQSHLLADLHEIDNSFAAAARLITSLDPADYQDHREEIIAALAKTSKPYFGDVETMTYQQWLERFVDLAFPFMDPTWQDRWFDLLHRIEARLHPSDHGEIDTLFPDLDSVADAPANLRTLLEAFPQAATTTVAARDAAWFVSLNHKHNKPMPWTTAIDGDLKKWFSKDTLWQAQEDRYDADAVRIIPGPVSVAGITKVDEPVAELLARFETGTTEALQQAGVEATKQYSRLGNATTAEEFLRQAPSLEWHGHTIANPAVELPTEAFDIINDGTEAAPQYSIRINTDSYWDDLPEEQRPFYVKSVSIPVDLSDAVATGASPVVDHDRLPQAVFELLAGLAGVGSTSESGDEITALPTIVEGSVDEQYPFGYAEDSFTLPTTLLQAHTAVTGAGLGDKLTTAPGTPDVLVGPAWPAIYTALGSGRIGEEHGEPAGTDYPVIEGLLNAVHLNHVIDLRVPLHELARGNKGESTARRIDVKSWCSAIDESNAGRIVTVELELRDHESGELVATQMQRFAIRGRATGASVPAPAPEWGGAALAAAVEPTPRSFVDRATVTAPQDMTPFALVSGDYNPIHTSTNAARLVNLDDALVHGMWLSATAQHLANTHGTVTSWTYSMFGMVQLGDKVEITAERVGRAGIHSALEVTCRIDGEVVSVGQALLAQPATAYVYPGQGVQAEGMGRGDRNASPAAREAWRRADHHTRTQHGFSIRQIIDDNPTELKVRGTTFRHPQGVLHLTQFTQVALAVVAYGQTERLRENNALATGAMYAGHSLGEYTALASLANIFDLEAVIDIVYSRGSAMGTLVERDEHGNSNYGMGALRPNMIGVSAEDVQDYVAQVAQETGEFLEIVNYNISGQQYSIAGTKAGLAELGKRATAIAPRAFVTVPGIDVPFHSRVLRDGVPAFADKLDELLPETLDLDALVGRYVPNLVARPFELTQDFVDATAALAPSGRLDNIDAATMEPQKLARLLLVELLSWQFASPVRWIETQELLFGRVDQIIEVGLASSPTLTNLAQRSMAVAGVSLPVYNVERDQDVVMLSDVTEAPAEVDDEDTASNSAAADQASQSPEVGADAARPTENPAPMPEAGPDSAAGAAAANAAAAATESTGAAESDPANASASASANTTAGGGAPAGELSFTAAEAIMTLFAFSNKIRLEQINDSDTVEELTNGVSSRRNQLLMDMSAELGVPAIDGAADADVATLRGRVTTAAPGYSPFGAVLSEAIGARLRQLTGAAGAKPAAVGERVTGTWALPQSWIAHVEAEILLGSREEDSVRGGSLATIPTSASSKAEVNELVDAAVQQVAARHGVAVSQATGGSGAGGGSVVDSAALNEFAEQVTGENGVLATAARTVLAQLGLSEPAPETPETDNTLFETVEAELGSGWVKTVAPVFDARKAVLFDDRWASAREDLARYALGQADITLERFRGTGATVAKQARWWAANGGQGELEEIAQLAESELHGAYAEDIALVTGAAPGSIATALIARLLEGGATVVMTASRVSQARKEFARKLYAEHAIPGAALWLVPANLSSYRDVDAVIDWIGTEQVESVGNEVKLLKPALIPTLAFPFAAPPVTGSLADAGPQAENQTRLLLWSVERTIAGLAGLAQAGVDKRCHVVLPGSPNRGVFGGDGAYGEVKAALDAIMNKWKVEAGWSDGVTLAQVLIGWVAGTHLMAGNDGLVPAVEAAGIRVWNPAEISHELMGLASAESRAQAAEAPLHLDLTGGLGDTLNMAELTAQAAANAEKAAAAAAEAAANAPAAPATITALPNIAVPAQPERVETGEITTDLDDMIVIAGVGEVSSWGSGRTRFEAEYGIQRDGSVELTAAGVLELAWMTGLVNWAEDPTPGWYDANGAEIAEEEIYARFRDEVVARAGVRTLSDKYHLQDQGSIDLATVFLDRDITFTVPSEAQARDIEAADPAFTRVVEADGEWQVTRLQGATAKVPRKATLTRTVAGQMPDNFDPTRWGIPDHMVDALDRMAVWNLVTAVDAFISAGFSPAELLQSIHPGDIASTQGTGIGGMESLHKVFVSRFLDEERPSDILQEALPNVIAAHTMQSLVGGYGSMIHPIGACATSAVSIEEGCDKIKLGKADVVVAGGIDDVQVESLAGFGDMNATAETKKMTDQGIDERFISRANDRRRGGFLEAEGGGTVLLVRGSLARELGLPVYAVVAHAASYADGAHTSIPAPGLGALGAGRGRENSRLAKSLRGLGLHPNDVTVLSKHDTSTNANDPNESELHSMLWPAVGRDADAPLFVISQKSLTGHSKAGAALFQTGGLIDVFRTGRVPHNAALDCVDPLIEPKAKNLVWLRDGVSLADAGRPVKAAVLTSLGFGHVGAVVVYGHPGVFEAAVAAQFGEDAAGAWREQANARLAAGAAHREAGMIGRRALFSVIEGRRLPERGSKEAEIALLLDEDARLGADGTYPLPGGAGESGRRG